MELEVPAFIAEQIFKIGSFSITNSMVGGVLTLVLIIIIAFVLRRASFSAGKFQTIAEMLYEALFSFVDQVTADNLITKRLFPIVGALFFYILISNLATLFPGMTSLTNDEGISLIRTHTTDFNTTFALAVGVVILSQAYSIKEHGLINYFNRFIRLKSLFNGFKQGIGKGLMSIIDFVVGFLDIVSEIAKMISLSLRLLGNVFAGEVMALVLLGIFPLLLPVPWIFMNVFSGTVQAIIFTALASAYLSMSIKE